MSEAKQCDALIQLRGMQAHERTEARLRAELNSAATVTGRMMAEYAGLRAVNAELLAALEALIEGVGQLDAKHVRGLGQARAAIARART